MSIQAAMISFASPAAPGSPQGCPWHAEANVSAEVDHNIQTPTGIDVWGSCQLCIPLATLLDLQLDLPAQAAHTQPLMGRIDFVSAPRAQAFKPPIS